ncbi:hypothetical protein [Larkinella harenae]
MSVPNAQRGSWNEFLHRTGPQNRIVYLNQCLKQTLRPNNGGSEPLA